MNITDYLKADPRLWHTLINSNLIDILPCGLSIATDVSCEKIIHNPSAAKFYEIEPYEVFSYSAKEPPHVMIYQNGKLLSAEEMPIQQATWYGKETHCCTLDLVWENGISKTASVSAIPLRNEYGTIIGGIASFEDISHITNLYRQKEKSNEILGRLIDIRTAALRKSENALIKANIELEQKVIERTRDLEKKNRLLSEEIEKVRITKKILRKSEEKYRTLFNSMNEGFCIIEVLFDEGKPVDICYLETNPAFEKLTGLFNIKGKSFSDIFEEECIFADFYANVVTTGEPAGICCYIEQLRSWHDIHAFKFGGPRSRQVAILVNDYSERKMAEEMLQEGKERALEVVEKLRQADQNKTAFLNMLSHELRNPLASMMMSLSLMEHVPPDGEEANRARIIANRQAIQLSYLVDNLLDVTRISQSKITLRKERVELNTLIKEAITDFQMQFSEKGVALEANLTSPLHTEADPARLTQVIGNLLHNAVKFTSKGDRALVTVTHDRKTNEAIVTVKDTGIGIKPELLPSLFEPFMQVDTSLDRSFGGLGLGLSIVKGTVELHGGNIAAHSDGPGQGAEFIIRMPIIYTDEEQSIKASRNSSIRPLSILVIDDIPDVADILCSLLSYLGHNVAKALSGPEGIAIAEEFHPEVLICDIGLPVMDGYDVAESFRSNNKLRDISLIALSGYVQPEDQRRSREAGFDWHLAKPVDLDTLQKVLAEVR